MLQIQNHLPLTTKIFFRLKNSFQKNYFVIDSKNGALKNSLYKLGNITHKSTIAVAFAVYFLALPLFVICEIGYKFSIKIRNKINTPLLDFHFAFISTVFKKYAEQLSSFVDQRLTINKNLANIVNSAVKSKNPFDRSAIDLIHCIQASKGKLSSEKSQREFHQTMLDHLRTAIKAKGEGLPNAHLKAFISDLCEWMYAEVDLRQTMKDFVFGDIGKATKPTPSTPLSETMDKAYSILKKDTRFRGIDESELRLYDAHYLGDTPSVQYKITGNTGKEIKILRTPVVTRDLGRGADAIITSVEIVPEFVELLETYQKKGKVHFYVNLMQRHGSEGIRSKEIESAEKKYPEALRVICLDKDSDFYWQKKEYSNQSDAAHFKQNLFDHMFASDMYYWSSHLDINVIKSLTQLIVNKIHEQYFNNQTYLDNQARLDFIELVYANIIDRILKNEEPDTCNISCKSCIDRGASTHGLQYIVSHNEKHLNTNHLEEASAFTLAPAILSMNRLLQHCRMPRLINAVKRYELVPHNKEDNNYAYY